MIHYYKIRLLDPLMRRKLRGELRAEYVDHKRQGYYECYCSERVKKDLVYLGICDSVDVITTTILKKLIKACG